MKTILSLCVLSVLTHAKAPECDVTTLTRDCRIFDSAPAEITLPDGTSFPNPRYPKTEATASQYGGGPFGNGQNGAAGSTGGGLGTGGIGMAPTNMEEYHRVYGETIQVRARLAKALDAEKNLSEDFKMNILSDPMSVIFMGVTVDKEGKFIKNPQVIDAPVRFFWPPNGKNSKYQDVPLAELISFLNSNAISSHGKKAIQKMMEFQHKNAAMYNPYGNKTQSNEETQKIQRALEAQKQKRKARALQLIDVAKRSFKKVFDRNPNQKDAEALQKTIDNLSFKFEDDVPAHMRDGCADGPNAYYDPSLHTFVICNSLLNYPDNQLVGIIGHEMGHSISICSLSLGLDKIDPAILNSLIMKPSKNANPNDNKELRSIQNMMPESKAVRIGNDYLMSESFVKYAEQIQLYTPIIRKIPKEEYPFQAAKECIVVNSNFRDVSKDDARRLTAKTAETFKEKGSAFSEDDQNDLLSRNERSIECLGGFDKTSETDEAISDMWGSLAMEEYLAENPPKTDLERLSLYSFFGSNFCSNHYEKPKFASQIRPQQLSLFQLKNVAQTGRMQEQARMSRSHPPDEVRLNDVYFSMPKIAEALGCSPGKNSECFDKLRNFSRAVTQKPETKVDNQNGKVQK